MGLKLRNYFLALVVAVSIKNTFAIIQCTTNQCNRNLIHLCNSENTFLRCATPNGTPIPKEEYTCPSGHVCVHTSERCVPGQEPFCRSGCLLCDQTTNSACLSDKKFAFCINNEPVLSLNGTCKETEHCVSTNPALCVPDTAPPSCNKAFDEIPPEPTTTEAPSSTLETTTHQEAFLSKFNFLNRY